MPPTVTRLARGDISVVGKPLNLSRTPARMSCASPDAGEHTDEILRELNQSIEKIAYVKNKGID